MSTGVVRSNQSHTIDNINRSNNYNINCNKRIGNKNHLTILQWNANGLKSRSAELKQFISQSKIKPDVICIQETHLKTNHKFQIVGYDCIRRDRLDRPMGGVAIFIKQEIRHSQLPNANNTEHISVKIKSNGTDLVIVNIYNPPGIDIDVEEYLNIFDHQNLIAVGDFNAYSPLWGETKTDKSGKIFEGIFAACDLTMLNTGSGTHLKRDGNLSAIDLSVASKSVALKCNWEVSDQNSLGSDHFPIFIYYNHPIDRDNLSERNIN